MKKTAWWISLAAGLGLLTVAFLQACSLTFGRPIVSYILWPSLALAAAACLYRAVCFRHYIKSRYLWLLALFCVSGLVSTGLNLAYGWYENLRTLILQAFFFFLIYCYRDDEAQEDIRRRNTAYIVYYLAGCALMSLIGFGYMLLKKGTIYFPEPGSAVPLYYTGFHWGRLYGIYWDPNIGALMCCVSAFLAAGWFIRERNRLIRCLMAAAVVIDVLYIAFSDSRTGRIALVVGTTVFACVHLLPTKKKGAFAAKLAAIVLVTALLSSCVKLSYNAISKLEAALAPADLAAQEQIEDDPQTDMTIIGREEDYQGDISNRRFDIWKSALEIFRTKPVFGIGHNNVLPYVEDNLPDSYLINNDHMRFESMHNTFLDVLVGQGALGLGLYLAMGLLFLLCVIKRWKTIHARGGAWSEASISLIAAVVTAGLFMSEIVYVMSPISFVFWLSLGELMRVSTEKLPDGTEGDAHE